MKTVVSLARHPKFVRFILQRPARAGRQHHLLRVHVRRVRFQHGLTPGAPFKTIAKVNALNLQPGDKVLFKCGDIWRGEMLMVTKSGASGSPIVYGSYPTSDCANKPILSGTQPIAGWSVYSGNIYVATLSAATFPNGINQLFRNGVTLDDGPLAESG